jgi:ABC-2 type transport system permease protein
VAGVSAAPAPLASPESREQFAAIAQLRWRIFVNSLRTMRGRLEVVSWIVVGFMFAAIGMGGTFGLGAAAWFLTSQHNVQWLALVLWGVMLYWQLFPVMATAFSESFDSTNFLRFPIRYRSYFLIRMAYGALDPTTLIGMLWLVGIAAGVGIADPALLPWAALLLVTFGALNILLARVIFAWIERWLARRKSREILGVFFLVLIVCIQFIGPVLGRYSQHHGTRTRPVIPGAAASLLPAEKFTPPGLVGAALGAASRGNPGIAVGLWALECAYAAVFLWLLDLRLRAQYRGENLSEAAPRAAATLEKTTVREGFALPGFPAPVAAVFEKEFHYLSRSGPMLFNLVMPLVILFIFLLGPASPARRPGMVAHGPGPGLAAFAFPFGVAYALLILSNLTFNSFGTEGAGVQFYFVAPVPFRQIMLAKNLMHGLLLAFEVCLLWVVVSLVRRPPSIGLTLATLAGTLFAALVNFTAGDLMSLYSPKKFDYAVFGRQRASGSTALVVVGVQLVIIPICAVTFAITAHYGRIWLATVVLLAFAAAAFAAYAILLNRIDRIATARRESLIAELCRAQ